MRLSGPVLIRPRLALDLDLPLWELVSGPPLPLASADLIVYHDRAADQPADRYALLEVSVPTDVDGVHLTPLLADPAAGLWVVRAQR